MNPIAEASEVPERLAWISEEDDPARYSAIEEACLRDSSKSFLIFWINRPSVFVGKNQNLWAQVSAREAFETGISLNRRLSGGGTVYHDPGNLNFSLISPGEPKIAFCEHLHLLFPYFESRNIAVEIRNRSDLFHGERKFSGNAEYFSGGRVLHHGTLLFDADLEKMSRLLTPDAHAYTDRAIDSNRSRTVNLRSVLPDLPDARSLAEDILSVLPQSQPGLRRIKRLPEDLTEKALGYLPRFRDSEWIFGGSPKYQLSRSCNIHRHTVSCELSVEKGRIVSIYFEENSRTASSFADIARILTGCLHHPAAIHECLTGLEKDSPEVQILSTIWLDLFF